MHGSSRQTRSTSTNCIKEQEPLIRRYYLFPYGWRHDNVEQAQGLDRLIDTMRRDDRDPALRVDIVARGSLDLTERPSEDGAIPIACWFFPSERHDRLAGNITVQDKRLSVLLTHSLPWGIPEVP